MTTKKRLIFGVLLLFVALTRFFGNGYDAYRHLHPDERHLVMVAGRINFFDQLDPDFFAYGSLPVYFLKAVAQLSDSLFNTKFDNYDGLLILGRRITSLIDVTTSLLVYLLALRLTKNRKIALASIGAYTLMFFPTQNSNFFVVDNFVNLFFSLTMLAFLNYWQKNTYRNLSWIGLTYGLLLSSKITPIIILPIIAVGVLIKELLSGNIKKQMAKIILKSGTNILLFIATTILTTMLFMPYAYLKYPQFIREVTAQVQMNSNAYVFPYTLQYVYTTPYLFHLKQIFLWGVGPIISALILAGVLRKLLEIKKPFKKKTMLKLLNRPATYYIVSHLLFFAIIGASAVKFMRYLLPLYPGLAIIAGAELVWLWQNIKLRPPVRKAVVTSIFLGMCLWYWAFLGIYRTDHSRIQASEWMFANIPAGSLLATEHWDDRLPLYGGEKFQFIDLPLYEQPDDAKKWQAVNQTLEQADYIILASNRLYGHLPKFTGCEDKPRCYPLTAQYYNDLFAEKLNFTKVAEFTNRPNLWGIEIIDDNADESFTVYDHPRVLIFQKK